MKARSFKCTVQFGRLVFAALVLMLTVCFSGSSVLAQNTGETKKDEPEDMFMLEEMVVTSQKRTERLQETTVAASVLPESTFVDANAFDSTKQIHREGNV